MGKGIERASREIVVISGIGHMVNFLVLADWPRVGDGGTE